MTKLEKAEKNVSKREKEKTSRRGQNKPPTKIVIRHLPPTMIEEDFLKQVDPIPEYDDYYFVEADWSLGYEATCRAYFTFKNYDDVFLFRDRFDGYVFVDTKGAEYPAIVEFAPFQGFMDHKSRRKDQNTNTIELDEHYQQFIKDLEAEREAAAKGGDNKLEFSLDRKKDEKITTTPLLEYLANKREKRREDKKRQRDEERDKRRQKDAQVTKIISIKLSKNKKDAKTNDAEQKLMEQDTGKKTPSKRARDQRRREEYWARKLERERERSKPTDSNASEQQSKKDNVSSKNSMEHLPEAVASTSNAKSNETIQQKDGKRYSEKRERHRNRKDKQKSREQNKDDTKKSSETDGSKDIIKKTGLNDVVKNFFDNFAVSPSEPNSQPQDRESNARNESKKLDKDMHEVKTQLEKLALKANSNDTFKDNAEGASEKKDTERKRHEIQSQRSTEERRIRNKDRPSIAIYQPKARLRVSEENSGKDAYSQPTSDCESLRKEETQRVKKVTRYSDRRAEMHAERRGDKCSTSKRRNRSDRNKSSNDSNDDCNANRREHSKSSEKDDVATKCDAQSASAI